jgi:hypothetical protein
VRATPLTSTVIAYSASLTGGAPPAAARHAARASPHLGEVPSIRGARVQVVARLALRRGRARQVSEVRRARPLAHESCGERRKRERRHAHATQAERRAQAAPFRVERNLRRRRDHGEIAVPRVHIRRAAISSRDEVQRSSGAFLWRRHVTPQHFVELRDARETRLQRHAFMAESRLGSQGAEGRRRASGRSAAPVKSGYPVRIRADPAAADRQGERRPVHEAPRG